MKKIYWNEACADIEALNQAYEQLQNPQLRFINGVYVQPKYFYSQIKAYLRKYPILDKCYRFSENEHFCVNRIKRITTPTTSMLLGCVCVEKDRFEDGIHRGVTDDGGLYFIGEVTANPHTEELLYWVKIGRTSNFRKRCNQYDTHCPNVFRIGYKIGAAHLEGTYHNRLALHSIAKASVGDEWFKVDRDIYLAMCEKGFAFFDD